MFCYLAPPVGGRTAREWSRAEPRVLVYGWVARKTVQFTVIISIPTGLHLSIYPSFASTAKKDKLQLHLNYLKKNFVIVQFQYLQFFGIFRIETTSPTIKKNGERSDFVREWSEGGTGSEAPRSNQGCIDEKSKRQFLGMCVCSQCVCFPHGCD